MFLAYNGIPLYVYLFVVLVKVRESRNTFSQYNGDMFFVLTVRQYWLIYTVLVL